MRKITLSILMALLMMTVPAVSAMAEPQQPVASAAPGTASPRDWTKLAPDGALLSSAVAADSAILMDASTGKVLFEKNADKKQFPASITKIMTCLVALDSKKNLSDTVTIGTLPKLEAGAETIDLKVGEQITLEDLLYGLMLESGNDAANAIAQYVGDGSIDNFISLMNAKAQAIGMTNTHYMNTNGLHNQDHFTTARDMALLAREASKYPEFTKLVSTLNYTMPATNKHSSTRPWQNHNSLIGPSSNPYYYKYATGIKTGYTSAAQSTLVASATKDSVQLIAVVLHDSKIPKWTDCVTMFEYGFKFYDTVNLNDLLASSTQTIPVTIKNAAVSDTENGKINATLLPKSKAYITDKADIVATLKNDATQFQQEVNLTKDTAPIKKDDVIGTVTYSYGGTAVLTCDLISPRDVNETPSGSSSASATAGTDSGSSTIAPNGTSAPQTSKGSVGTVFLWFGIILLVLLIAMVAIRFVNMQRRNKKYRQYNYRAGNSAKFKR